MTPGCTTRGRHGCIRVYRHKPRLLCLNIHTHWKVSNSLEKCKRCLNALHRYTCPAASQLHALYLIVLNQLASYSIALPLLIESTWTDSCCLKSKISHEKIALKIPAEAIVFVNPCENVHYCCSASVTFGRATKSHASR